MSLTDGLLVVIVIVMLSCLVMGVRGRGGASRDREWDCVDRSSGEVTTVSMQYQAHGSGCKCPSCSSPEKDALAANAEHFSMAKSSDIDEGACDANGKFEFASHEFGGAGLEYKDWVMQQSVDGAVVRNHSEFVKDRLGGANGQITGKTWIPADSHDSEVSGVPWVGIRGRPQAVAVHNPTQVPDSATSVTDKPRFNWNSS